MPSPEGRSAGVFSLKRLRLRFKDRALEATFRDYRFHLNLGNVRFAFVAGIMMWLFWGLLMRPYIGALADQRLDFVMRFRICIPMLVVGLALTFAPFFGRIWEWVSAAVAVATILLWLYYFSQITTLPAEYGYIGIILITAYTYTLLRLRFSLVMLVTVVGIVAYLLYAFGQKRIDDASRALATLFLISFGLLGGLSAYRTERYTRILFLRERQLDEERLRSDGLLLNILPQAIIDELKTSSRRIAHAFDEVSVVFIDAVGSTAQASRSSPERFADALDELFRRFDRIADRQGLEKIKTIGDAYLAVSGAPTPMAVHAEAAVAMALDVLAAANEVRWPSGDPIAVRVGVASGPVVAGVIGDRKFAYDIWGDTVNMAKRLQEVADPGQVLVSGATAEQVAANFECGPVQMVELKGRGPSEVRALVRRRSDVEVEVPSEVPSSLT